MNISIIVPAFNEAKLIAGSLRSIREAMTAFAERGWETELIVCDNNSTDSTAELARAEGALVVFEPVNQIARARNAGASVATGDWLIFVDADSHPSKELFADVAGEILTGRSVAGGATVELDERKVVMTLVVSIWNCISRVCRYMAGSFIFCEAAAFREVGGFNQEMFVAEELDLSKRMKRLARRRNRRVCILHAHPLRTSARKFHLYSAGRHLNFLARTVLKLGGTMRSAKECDLWYDGRR